MNAPHLVSLRTAVRIPDAARGWPADRVFAVVRSGAVAGRRYQQGQLVLCGAEPVSGDAVVLVARDGARPRAGTVHRGVLYGDLGEVCAPSRWTPLSVERLVESGERLHVLWGGQAPRPSQPASAQLSLFAA